MSVRLDDFDDVLFIADVAKLLKTSVRTIERQLRAGVFPIPQIEGIDKKRRWAKATVAAFVVGGMSKAHRRVASGAQA